MNCRTTRWPTVRLARARAALPLSVVALLLLVPRHAPADAVADFEAMRANQQKNTDAALSSMPPVDARHVDDVLQLRLEAGNFVVRTPLPATKVPGYGRAKVAEVAQPLMVRVVGNRGGGADGSGVTAAVPEEFLLQLLDYSTPRRITNLSVAQTGPATLTIAYGTTTPAGSRNVQLTVQRDPRLAGGSVARLDVNESDADGGFGVGGFGGRRVGGAGFGSLPVSRSFVAPDCAALIREQPRAVDAYLRPILAELAQEGVLAPDPVLVAQVFPETVKVDDATAARVAELLPDLAAYDYRRRDRATAGLEALGAAGAKVLLVRTDRSALTPEQNARIDRVLVPLGVVAPARAAELRRDPEFLLNCLYSDDPPTRRSAAAALKDSAGGAAAGVDPDAPAGTRAAAVRELRKKLLPPTAAP